MHAPTVSLSAIWSLTTSNDQVLRILMKTNHDPEIRVSDVFILGNNSPILTKRNFGLKLFQNGR